MLDATEPIPGIARVLAPNPSAMTLEGTNTWVVGGWVVDPGPAVDSHVAAVKALAEPLEGVVLTHSHADHSGAAPLLGVEARVPRGGERVGPFEAIATPGHSADSVCLLHGKVLFTGDTVLGAGSVFIAPGEGSLKAYLDSLSSLLELELEAICPGHGPVVFSPHDKLREYIEHRLERERLVLEALAAGMRTREELLDRAWAEVDFAAAPILRHAAGASLAAHLEKLAAEDRVPEGVEAIAFSAGFPHEDQ